MFNFSSKSWGSWRTTLIGIAILLAAIGTEAKNLLDDDPATTFTMAPIMAALAGLGLMVARDNKVTSEEAGADAPPPGSKGLQRPGSFCLLFAASALAASAGGCAGGQSPLQQVFIARQTYVTVLNSLSPLMETGVIADQATKDSIYAARVEAAAAIADAEARAAAGQTLGFDFVMARVHRAIDILLAAYIRNRGRALPNAGIDWGAPVWGRLAA